MKKTGLAIAVLTFVAVGAWSQPAQQNQGMRQVNLHEVKKLSMSQLLSKASRLVDDSSQMYSSVLKTLKKAGNAKDSSKVSCLRNLIPAMKGLVRIGQQSLLNLKELSATNDRMDAESQFVKVVISNRKMLELNNRAQQCGSANIEQVFARGVQVQKEILPGVPSGNIVDDATRPAPEVDPYGQEVLSPPDRFSMMEQANVVPSTEFY